MEKEKNSQYRRRNHSTEGKGKETLYRNKPKNKAKKESINRLRGKETIYK